MSIPGLGQIPSQPIASATRTVTLQPSWEWRFQVPPGSSITVKLTSGTAEKDGIELALRNPYHFSATNSKILSWQGCELAIEGECASEAITQPPNPAVNPATSYLNLHMALSDMRAAAEQSRIEGPRVLIAGPAGAGKTTLVRTLAAYATRQGDQPLVVNTDPRDSMLSLPGTLSASVFATVMDPEAADAWGSTPTSGPSLVPVKLPLVYLYGRERADENDENGQMYKQLISKMAEAVSGRLSEDLDVRKSGVVVDTMAINQESENDLDLLCHVVDELSVNIVVILESRKLNEAIIERLGNEKTSLGEPISITLLEKSDGVVSRHNNHMNHIREAIIKEYFFGDARRSLSPQIQQVDFANLTIYKLSEDPNEGDNDLVLQTEVTSVMEHWTLAVMHASPQDSADKVRIASVMGFVYISEVDEVRRKIKILAPIGGRLGSQPMIWGQWPEPYINLLG